MPTYKDLAAWKKGIELVQEIYRISDALPKSEQYILVSQMFERGHLSPQILQKGIVAVIV